MISDGFIAIETIEDKQKILLYLFNLFHNLCEENGLVYNAFGGTMLGAVRHKGFIPWDDDIDVTMPRNDYEKLLELLRNSNNSLLQVHSYPDDNYIYPYAKVGLKGTIQFEDIVKSPYNKLSINMDVFPVDGYPENESEIDEYCGYENNIILCVYKLRIVSLIKHPKILIKKIQSVKKGYKYWLEKQISLASKNDENKCDYLLCQGAGWGRKGIIEKKTYYDRSLYDFEGIQIWGIKDYDAHMTRLYGDYMELPPVEKRTTPHINRTFISKTKYLEIINR